MKQGRQKGKKRERTRDKKKVVYTCVRESKLDFAGNKKKLS